MNYEQISKQLASFWTNQMPFNQLLGLNITKFDPQESEVKFDWQPQLVGNPVHNILHGGVTASALDLVGGVVAAANVIYQLDDLSMSNIEHHMKKMGTIDLRTDYLRPGRGESFVATAKIIRSGNKVAVARMELHNENNDHIAFGTGTYLVG